MAKKAKSDERYVLLLDLLGFSARIKAGEAKACMAAVHRMLDEGDRWTRSHSDFEFLHFSDTIVVYAKSPGSHKEWYDDLVFVGSRIVIHLLQSGWPIRGALAFGEFIVQKGRAKPVTFVGRALVDAHEAERCRKALGFVVLPSALAAAGISMSPAASAYFLNEGIGIVEPSGEFSPNFLTRFRRGERRDLDFMLNKWADSTYSPEPIEDPWFVLEMQAVRFIYYEMVKFEAGGEEVQKYAEKYRNSWRQIQALQGHELYRNVTGALGIGDSSKEAAWKR